MILRLDAMTVLGLVLLPRLVFADLTISDPTIPVGTTTEIVLSDSERDFGADTEVSLGDAVALHDVTHEDGDIHCIVTGIAPGTSPIVVKDPHGTISLDPGIICYRDAADLGRIIESVFRTTLEQIGSPGAGALHAGFVLFEEARSRSPDELCPAGTSISSGSSSGCSSTSSSCTTSTGSARSRRSVPPNPP